jgi:peroxiredoxin
MTELRGLAQKADELKKLDVRVIAISVDSQEHARGVWENVANKKFTILSDPGAGVIKTYGLLHANGAGAGQDIALRTTLLVDPNGIKLWRRVSESVPDIPTIDETLAKIKDAQGGGQRGVDQQH